ncbi:MAG TPA: hypothetical protein VFS43_41505 [Polyangiaceae bacterium]|nr:hypothetical protein [Polyangiaceae bacterium]
MGRQIRYAEASRTTLEATPAKVLTFLRAVGTSKAIRALIMARGYTAADHQEGWSLLHKVSGLHELERPEEIDEGVRDAINELDTWDEDGYRLVRAALTRKHPAQAEFVLSGLAPATGGAAVLSVKNLLDRLDALEKSPARKATRAEDRAALETLAKRGITPQERARLRALVNAAQTAAELRPDERADDDAAAKAQRESDLVALRAWYVDWAETARVGVKRRDYLIRLGLGQRRRTSTSGADEGTADELDDEPGGED